MLLSGGSNPKLKSGDRSVSDQPHPSAVSLSASLIGRIDQVCDRFEDAWRAGQRPAIEDYLGGTAEACGSQLLLELLCLEIHYRCQNGETVVADDYVSRFPAHADLIRAAFS